MYQVTPFIRAFGRIIQKTLALGTVLIVFLPTWKKLKNIRERLSRANFLRVKTTATSIFQGLQKHGRSLALKKLLEIIAF